MPRLPRTTRQRALRAAINLAVLACVLVGIRMAIRTPGRAHGEGAPPPPADLPALALIAPQSAVERAEALAARPPRVRSEEDLEEIEDPAALRHAGRFHLAAGETELARACFTAELRAQELNHYVNFERRDAFRALLHERMGETEQAELAWQDGIEKDLHHTYLFCRLLSLQPSDEVEARLAGMREELERRIDAVEAGEEVHWYTTKSGASRELERIDQAELVRRARAVAEGRGKTIRYVYLPELDLATLPPDLDVEINSSVIGSLRGYGAEREARFGFQGFVVEEFHLGKKWLGRVNLSSSIPPARLGETFFMETIVLCDADVAGTQFGGRNASFVFALFEGAADFGAISVARTADFRYASFATGVTFRRAVLEGPVHFGQTRYGGAADFSAMVCTTRRAHFNSCSFADRAAFEKVDWRQGGTLEDSTFGGPLVVSRARLGARTNLSRCHFGDGIQAREVVSHGMDFFGSVLHGSSDFTDTVFDGHVRFSLDEVTYREFERQVDELHKLYKVYQGDEDAAEDLTSRSMYGVETVDDLTAYIPGEISFANVMFQEFCQFQRVVFGEAGQPGTADFYNAQFRGETHFERAVFHADADFTTIFANELGLNDATFHGRVMLDDANVPGRVTLSGARFRDGADLSIYGAQIARFYVNKEQLEERRGRHRLFYERCALGRVDGVEADPRIDRALASYRPGEERPEVVDLCYERLAEDFNVLNNAFAERGLAADEDWAYWYGKHHETMHALKHGGLGGRANALFKWFLFEVLFGWGVKLQNLALAVLFVVVIYGILYKLTCPDAKIEFNGFETSFRHLTFVQAIFISLLSLLCMDIGWDIGRNRGFRWLNVTEVILGIIILTFFVGAYTRLVLA